MKITTFSVEALLLILAGCTAPREMTMIEGQQQSATFSTRLTWDVSTQYLVYLPEGYASGQQQWPLVLFLHGAGERGADLEIVKRHGPPKLVAGGKEFPFILISPQCPEDETWSPRILDALLDEVERMYRVDPDRIYLTGLSMGGNGTWRLAMARPDRFAAIAPICGWGDTNTVCVLKHVPVWAFHGKKDKVVLFERSEKLVKALKKCGGLVQFTAYPKAEHDSWTETYDNPALYEWLLAQKRTPSPSK
jgi:predicted peptidase